MREMLERDALHRAPVLRAPRHALRGRSRHPAPVAGAIADPPVFRRARAVARYDDVARALVHRLKYGDRLELAKALGAMMARAGAELLAEAT